MKKLWLFLKKSWVWILIGVGLLWVVLTRGPQYTTVKAPPKKPPKKLKAENYVKKLIKRKDKINAEIKKLTRSELISRSNKRFK